MRVVGLLDHQVERLGALVLDIGASSVKMDVVGDRHAGLDDGGKQEIFSHAPLVRRDHVAIAEN